MNRMMHEAFEAIRKAEYVTTKALSEQLYVSMHRAGSIVGALRAKKLVRPGPYTCTWSLTDHGKRLHTVMEVMLS